MQTGASPGSEKPPRVEQARRQEGHALDSATAELSGQSPTDRAPSGGNGKDRDPRFEATRNATIMLVDDEPIIVEILKSVLEDAGYHRFIETSESTQALALLTANTPDLVLLDVNMPEVTGLDILNGMRGDEALKHIPAIVLTGATDSATELLAPGPGSHRRPRQAGGPQRARASRAQYVDRQGVPGSVAELR